MSTRPSWIQECYLVLQESPSSPYPHSLYRIQVSLFLLTVESQPWCLLNLPSVDCPSRTRPSGYSQKCCQNWSGGTAGKGLGHGGDSGWDHGPFPDGVGVSGSLFTMSPHKWRKPRLKVLCRSHWAQCPPTVSLRAHFLQGAFSEEELARLSGQQVATLSPMTHWQIHNVSGVRAELWIW